MPGRYNVYVLEDGGRYFVKPAVAMVSHEFDPDGVKVRNLTMHTVEVSLPVPIRSGPAVVSIDAGQVATIAVRTGVLGIFDYAVDVLAGPGRPGGPGSGSGPGAGSVNRVAALGNSFPKIIVDP